jgi:transcriptional regulator with XRE-family HTH domain
MSEEKIFPQRLRQLRTGAGLSQADLGGLMGRRQVTVSTWENGTREPSLADLARLAGLLGVTADNLLGLGPPEPPVVPARTAGLAALLDSMCGDAELGALETFLAGIGKKE